jgi:thymidylate synthase (FAD)
MTIAVTPIDFMGSDLSVVNAARVSFGKQSFWVAGDGPDRLKERDAKLIRYLAKHKHISPFGHAFASFHVKCPLFVHAQLVKHKFLRVNTISRRYVDDNIEFYVPDVWRGRSADKKQGSEGVIEDIDPDVVESLLKCVSHDYNYLIEKGVAPEQARMVLPQSLMTEFIWSGSLDAFAAMCQLRLKSDTQYETRLVAEMIDFIMEPKFPVSWKALLEND